MTERVATDAEIAEFVRAHQGDFRYLDAIDDGVFSTNHPAATAICIRDLEITADEAVVEIEALLMAPWSSSEIRAILARVKKKSECTQGCR
jgi:hypothetical protein